MNGKATRTTVGGAARSFTLLEVVIAIGLVSLVALGLAVIFEATGRTVSTGRRVSALNEYASLIEQRMRRDIERMSRRGFMVIRNEHAQDGGPVSLYVGDTTARARRIDEIMFFIEGDEASARDPIYPGVAPRANSARVWYGHGKRQIRPTDPNAPYFRPVLDDANADRNANLGYPAVNNPNLLASSWTLLRHVTLLAPTRGVERYYPPDFYQRTRLGVREAIDSDVQVALQPAASNIFRTLAAIFPNQPEMGQPLRGFVRPQITSGLVDVATTDLSEIDSIVQTADTIPSWATIPQNQRADGEFFDPTKNEGPDGTNKGADGKRRPLGRPNAGGDPFVLRRQQAWMLDALPAYSHAANVNDRTRIRYESGPTDFLGVLREQAYAPLERSYRLTDQAMLAASNFLPGCTEFIVEWSFGNAYPQNPGDIGYVPGRAGELIWHGLERTVQGRVVAEPYEDQQEPKRTLHRKEMPYTRVDGRVGWFAANGSLLHGFFGPRQGTIRTLESYFGTVDPRFVPDSDNDGRLESMNDSRDTTIAWPWPKLIRVTVSLTDPSDPTREETFQFVFDVPARPGE